MDLPDVMILFTVLKIIPGLVTCHGPVTIARYTKLPAVPDLTEEETVAKKMENRKEN